MPESYFIQDDGYSLWGHIPRRPGLYPQAYFRYRPAPPALVRRYRETAGAERDAASREIISMRIDGLRMTMGAEPMPLKADDLDKMHDDLFQQLLNHALGFAGPALELMEKNSEPAST
jgi:fido (protein-threonine AMPylation protein)